MRAVRADPGARSPGRTSRSPTCANSSAPTIRPRSKWDENQPAKGIFSYGENIEAAKKHWDEQIKSHRRVRRTVGREDQAREGGRRRPQLHRRAPRRSVRLTKNDVERNVLTLRYSWGSPL